MKPSTVLKVVLIVSCSIMMAWDRSQARMEQAFKAQVKQVIKQVKSKPRDTVCLPDGTCYKRPTW